MKPSLRLLAAGLLVGLLAPSGLFAQDMAEVGPEFLDYVLPGAERFSVFEGDPSIIRGFRVDEESGDEVLIGYVFLTGDWPPEEMGYSGPIEALVGMDLDGWLTGVIVWKYWESHRNTRGDFLRVPGFQEQFTGKHIGDPFAIRQDVDGISGATISVHALARGVRNAARRVANAYIAVPEPALEAIEDLTSLPWLEMIRLGVVERMVVSDHSSSAEILLIHVPTDEFGELLIGPNALGMIARRQEIKARDGNGDGVGGGRVGGWVGGHRMVYAVNGSYLRFFRRAGWSVAQDGDTIPLAVQDVFPFGGASGGILRQQAGTGGTMIIDEAIDIAKPFSMLFSLDSDSTVFSTEYVTQPARRAMALEAAAAAAALASNTPVADPPAEEPTPVEEPEPDASSPESIEPTAAPDTPPQVIPPALPPQEVAQLDFTIVEEETLLARMLAGTSWNRVFLISLLLGLATAAFLVKNPKLMWATLTFTLLFLGFVDGGFLSVSHITSLIWVGSSAFVTDLPLLIMALFTVVTTLWFGRVFCGFLCPFGALQDFLTRLVPRRFRLRVPWGVHRRAIWIKYGVLLFVLIPAIAGSRVSLYQYVEPFGTVFFRSTSILLWTIAAAFLVASAIIPRSYCRYVCPLGAALAAVSVISLNRIRRVEHCDHCKVCEQKCPTGAIRGPAIDFKECVRCNICEIKLDERAGVCGHEIEDVKRRLVQIQRAHRVEVADAS